LHSLVCLEGEKSKAFRIHGEFLGGYCCLVPSYVVSLDGDLFVTLVN